MHTAVGNFSEELAFVHLGKLLGDHSCSTDAVLAHVLCCHGASLFTGALTRFRRPLHKFHHPSVER